MSTDYGVRRILGDLPALGGRIKEVPEDFVVEELPASVSHPYTTIIPVK